jgi:hypothetical protein
VQQFNWRSNGRWQSWDSEPVRGNKTARPGLDAQDALLLADDSPASRLFGR